MGGWQCLCLAILALPYLDAAKLVHTGTETYEKDGVKHERSRYRLVPDHENEPVDEATIKILPNDKDSTNLTVGKHAKTVAIKSLPNEKHNDELKVDNSLRKVAIKVLPNERYTNSLKADKHTKKVALKILPNDAQEKHTVEKNKTGNIAYRYLTKTHPNSGATLRTRYHYSNNRQPESPTHKTESNVTEWSSGRKNNSSGQNLWNNVPSKELYSYVTRRLGDSQNKDLDKKNEKLLLNKSFLELNNKLKARSQSKKEQILRLTAEEKLQMRLLIKSLVKLNKLNPKSHHETTKENVRREFGHDDLQWKLTMQTLLQELLSKMHTLKDNSEAAFDHDNKKIAVSAYGPKSKATQQHSNDFVTSRPETLEHGHSARFESKTMVHNDTYKDSNEYSLQTGNVLNQTSEHTKTEHLPLEKTKVKNNEKPIQFHRSDLLRSLISSVGLNKTFVTPGEKGRYKLVHEGDEETDLIHGLKSQNKHIPSINIPENNISDVDGHFENKFKVLPLHRNESYYKKPTTYAQSVSDIPVGIYDHDSNEILPKIASDLDSSSESIIHIDKELGTNPSTTEKIDVTTELKMVVEASEATTTDNTLITTDNIISSTDNELTTISNILTTTDNTLTTLADAYGATDNDSDSLTSATENPEVSTTEDIDISKLLNDPLMLKLLSLYGVDMNNIIDEPENNMVISSLTDQPVKIVPSTAEEKGANNHGYYITNTPKDYEVSTTEAINISKLYNNAPLLEDLSSYRLDMHGIADEPVKHIAFLSLDDHGDTFQKHTTTAAIETDDDGVGVTSTTVDHEGSTTEVPNISKFADDLSLLELLSLYGLDVHDIFDQSEIQISNPSLASQHDETTEANNDDINRPSTIENPEVSTTEVLNTSMLENDPSLLELPSSYGLKMHEIVDVPSLKMVNNSFNTQPDNTGDSTITELNSEVRHLQTAHHLPQTDDDEVTSEGGKPLYVLDEINEDKDDSDDLKEKFLALPENKTELENLQQLEQNISTDDPLSEYENLPTEPVDNHNSLLPGTYMDDNLKFRMDNLQRERNHHKNIDNVSSNDLVNSEQTLQGPDQSKDLNQTWPQSWHAKETPRSSRIIYREEIRHSGNDIKPNINVHNVNDHYLQIILGYLNSDILTNELNALMAYSGPGRDRNHVTLQFVIEHLNKLGITHHISQEQLQFLTHQVLKHLLDYNKHYKVRKIEWIYEFNHPHDITTNLKPVYMPPKNPFGQFLSDSHNVHTQENVPNVLTDAHLVPNYHQNDIDINDHNLALHPNLGDVSDQTHLRWYNQNPDIAALSDLNAHLHSDDSSNQNHVVSVSDLYNTPSLHQLINQDLHHNAPYQNLHAQNYNNVPEDNSVVIEQRNLFPDSDQGLSQKSKNDSNDHYLNFDHNNSDQYLYDTDHFNLAPGDVDHHQQSNQLAPNDNIDQNEPHLLSDHHLSDSEHSNFVSKQDYNVQNDNLAPNHNADFNKKELNLDHHNPDHHLVDSDNSNFAPGQDHNNQNDNVAPNHNADLNGKEFDLDHNGFDHHLVDSDNSYLISGQDHKSKDDNFAPKHNFDLNVLDLDFEHHNFNTDHNNSDHLNLLPEHNGHNQPNDDLNPNHNVDQNKHNLNSLKHNSDHQTSDSDHLNFASGHQQQNDHLLPNQIPDLNEHQLHLGHNNYHNNHDIDSVNFVPNLESDLHHPNTLHVDSDHLNLIPDYHGHHQQNDNFAPKHNFDLNEHDLDFEHHNFNNEHTNSDHLNLLPEHNGHHQPDDNLDPNRNVNRNEHNLNPVQHNPDHQISDSDHLNFSSGHQQQNNHLVSNEIADLNEQESSSGKNTYNNNLHVDSDHLNLIPDYHSHHQQNGNFTPKHNFDLNEHDLDFEHHNFNNDHTNSDHLNLLPEHNGHHQPNDNLDPNHNVNQNENDLNSVRPNPDHQTSDSDHLNFTSGHQQQNYHVVPIQIADLNEHELDSSYNNYHGVDNFVPNLESDPHHPNKFHVDSDHLNVIPDHHGHYQQNNHLAPNHYDNNEYTVALGNQYTDENQAKPEHSNLANHNNNYLAQYQNAYLNKHELDFDHNNPNNNHHIASDNLVPNLDSDQHHPDNHDVYSDHSNTNEHLSELDHSNSAHGQDGYHSPNGNLNSYHNILDQQLGDSDQLHPVPGKNENLAQNHGSYSNQPNLGSNQYNSYNHWGAHPGPDFDSNPNVYSSPYQQITRYQTKQSNLVYEPHHLTFGHQQNIDMFPSPPHHQIEPWSYKENGKFPHQVGVDPLGLYYIFPNQQFDYSETSLYPQSDNFGQWISSDYLNQPNLYPPYSYQQNEWYSPYQTPNPEHSNGASYGLAYPNIDLSSYSHQPYQLSYTDQNVNVDQRINLPTGNQHNGYETVDILDGTHLQEYLTDGIDLPNPGVVNGLFTKVQGFVRYLLDHGVSENMVLEFVDDVKKELAEEFLERLKECQNRAYSILIQSISNLAQGYLQKYR